MPKKNPEKEERRVRRRELTEFLNSVGVSDVVGVGGRTGALSTPSLRSISATGLPYSSSVRASQRQDERLLTRPPLTRPIVPAMI